MTDLFLKPGRIRCINPRCNRTFKDEGGEIICGKCWKMLPAELRNAHKAAWRELRRWRKRITRTSDELQLDRLHRLEKMASNKVHLNWLHIKAHVITPDRPEGLDPFLEEIGLK